MGVVIKDTKDITAHQLSQVFEKSGIRRPYQDLERMRKMLDHADILLSAWEGDRLVGIARALTDYAYCCYLSDLAVDQEFQKRGIGRQLIDELQARLGDEVALVLLSAPAAMDYYPKIGFSKADHAFLIPRKK